MAVTDWTGASDGNLNNAANWTGAVAGAGDTARFIDGAKPVTTGLAALAAVNLANFIKGPGYKGDIGHAGAYLQVGATNVYIDGTAGTLFLKEGSSDEFDNVYITRTGPKGVDFYGDMGAIHVNGGIMRHRGDGATIQIDDLFVNKLGTEDTSVILGGSGIEVDVKNFVQNAGSCSIETDTAEVGISGKWVVNGGVFTWKNTAAVLKLASPLEVNGGVVYWNSAVDPASDQAVICRGSAVLSFAGDTAAKTPGTGSNMQFHDQSQLVLANGCRNVLATNVYQYGTGKITVDRGVKITAMSAI